MTLVHTLLHYFFIICKIIVVNDGWVFVVSNIPLNLSIPYIPLFTNNLICCHQRILKASSNLYKISTLLNFKEFIRAATGYEAFVRSRVQAGYQGRKGMLT
jgi:hypothetical protein